MRRSLPRTKQQLADVVQRYDRGVVQTGELRKYLRSIIDAGDALELRRGNAAVALLVPVPETPYRWDSEKRVHFVRALRRALKKFRDCTLEP